eukprot:1086019-Karenia_brevis.AAC.1
MGKQSCWEKVRRATNPNCIGNSVKNLTLKKRQGSQLGNNRLEVNLQNGGKKSAPRNGKTVASRVRAAGVQPEQVGTRAQRGAVTLAEEKSVSAPVQRQYSHYFQLLLDWCGKNKRSLEGTVALTTTVLDFIDVMLTDGYRSGDIEKMVASVSWKMAHASLTQDSRIRRALKGARKLKPNFSRLGMVDASWCALVGAAMAMGFEALALFIAVSVELYLRPSEGLSALAKDIAGPSRVRQQGLGSVSLTLAASDTTKRTKTGAQDDTLIIDGMLWLGPLIVGRKQKLDDDALLFGLDPVTARRQWELVCQKIGVIAHLYQLRHTGPSRDALSGRCDTTKIMAKGRWMSLKSVKRYSKPGGLQRVEKRLDPRQVQYGEECVARLQEILEKKVVLMPPAELSSLKVNIVR